MKKEEEIPEDNLKEKAEEKEKEAEKQKEQKEQKQHSEKKIDKEQKQKQKEKEENSSQTNPNEKIVYHTVAKGENLYRIALKYYPNGDGMGKIKAANNMTTDQVQLGQTLKIIIEP
ncbi:hypothetical protein CHH55_14855 [Niallia circulans]|nr:hypothetical protein CHH62_18230 [Niallia circulans]PAD87003.1 hypothetical protein CHH55_14855 [Niallia circulans]